MRGIDSILTVPELEERAIPAKKSIYFKSVFNSFKGNKQKSAQLVSEYVSNKSCKLHKFRLVQGIPAMI